MGCISLTKKHIVKNIIPRLIDGLEFIGDDTNGTIDVSILLAYKDKLYKITRDLTVLHLNEFGGTGSGIDFAYRTCNYHYGGFM